MEGRILQLIFMVVSADVSLEFPEQHNHRSFISVPGRVYGDQWKTQEHETPNPAPIYF